MKARRWFIVTIGVLPILVAIALRAEEHLDQPVAKLEGCGGEYVQFSKDGSRIVTSDGHNARVWDAQTLKPIGGVLRSDGKEPISEVRINSDASRLLVAQGNAAIIYDARNSRAVATVNHLAQINCAKLSPKDREIATAGEDGFVRVWDVLTGTMISEFHHDGPATFVEFSPDGNRLLSIHKGTPFLWDVRNAREIEFDFDDGQAFSGHDAAAFSANSRRMVIAGVKGFFVYDAVTLKQIATSIDPDGWRLQPGWISSVGISPDGKRIYTIANDSTRVWDADTGKPITDALFNGLDIIGKRPHAAFSIDGRFALVGNVGPQGVWDLTKGRGTLIQSFGNEAQNSIAFSPDGKWVATGDSARGMTKVWTVRGVNH